MREALSGRRSSEAFAHLQSLCEDLHLQGRRRGRRGADLGGEPLSESGSAAARQRVADERSTREVEEVNVAIEEREDLESIMRGGQQRRRVKGCITLRKEGAQRPFHGLWFALV